MPGIRFRDGAEGAKKRRASAYRQQSYCFSSAIRHEDFLSAVMSGVSGGFDLVSFHLNGERSLDGID